MSKKREMEGEEESKGLLRDDCNLMSCCKKWVLSGDSATSFGVSPHTTPPEKFRRVCETVPRTSLSCHGFSSKEHRLDGSLGVQPEPQDADYAIPPLIDEVEALILARVPRSEYRKFYCLNKRFLALLKSGELYKIRSELGVREPSVFVSASGEKTWWEFDRQFKSCRKLPVLPSDDCFARNDRESLCVGTHLLVSGKETESVVVWRFDLEASQWFKGPSMITPRILFASATCGSYGYVAGGMGLASCWKAMNSAERYNPDTKSWEPLPNMKKMRKLCSGCYMDNKFYVIGGRDQDGKDLNCAEVFDMEKNTWELIPDMFLEADDDAPDPVFNPSPPLIAVVNNELYSLERCTNELKVYLKRSKSWKKLGPAPVRADANSGWGIAFKSLGNELLLIASSSNAPALIYTCCPDPNADELQWEALEKNHLTRFILNCSVMVA